LIRAATFILIRLSTSIRENNAASGIGVLATYSYTPTGQRAAVTYGNGTSRSYAYDTAGRTIGVKLDLAGTEHDLVIGAVAGTGTPVAYNPAGQIVSLSRSNDLYAWTAHSLFERDYAVNGINQYTSAGGVTLGHDGRGNLVQSGSSTYGYSRLNELTSAPNPIGGTIALSYDPKGRLTQVNAGTPVRLVYAGPNLVTETGPTGSVLRRYVHGPGADDPIVWYEGPGTASRSATPAARSLASTATTNTASRRPATWAGSSTPARPGGASWGCIITRRGGTLPRWAGLCRPIRSGIRTT